MTWDLTQDFIILDTYSALQNNDFVKLLETANKLHRHLFIFIFVVSVYLCSETFLICTENRDEIQDPDLSIASETTEFHLIVHLIPRGPEPSKT